MLIPQLLATQTELRLAHVYSLLLRRARVRKFRKQREATRTSKRTESVVESQTDAVEQRDMQNQSGEAIIPDGGGEACPNGSQPAKQSHCQGITPNTSVDS